MDIQVRSRINDVLFEVHRDLAGDLSAKRLAKVAAYSEHHFHRVFAAVVGESFHAYVRRVRLEHAANLLMFDHGAPVRDIALVCGFLSLSSFSRAFKEKFQVSPGQWRKAGAAGGGNYMDDPDIRAGYQRVEHVALPEAKIIESADIRVAYLRHKGYGRGIRNTWLKLLMWAKEHGYEGGQQIGLHHSNPAWFPLEECRYVACIEIDRPLERRTIVNTLTIPGGLHAQFELNGRYGELLPYLGKIFEQWLPESGFKLGATPAWVSYRENQFISPQERFSLTINLPIRFY